MFTVFRPMRIVLDAQNGFERALNAAIPALAGADELSGIGEMEAGVMGSYAQMVADNEFAGSIVRSEKVSPRMPMRWQSMWLRQPWHPRAIILGQKHTMKYLKSGEVYLDQLAERCSWEAWEYAGRRRLGRTGAG